MDKVKSILNIHTLVAAFIYLVTCIFLYLLQYRLYAGAMKTVFIHAAIYPPVMMIAQFMSDEDNSDHQKSALRRKFSAVYGWITALISVFISIYMIYTNPCSVLGYQTLCLLIMFAVIYVFMRVKKTNLATTKSSFLVSVVYSAIFAVTAVFLLIAKPLTVDMGYTALREKGYQNIEYVKNIQSENSIRILLGDDQYDIGNIADDLGVYLFCGEANGESYGVFIEVTSGIIVAQERMNDNPILSGMIELERAKSI